MDKYEFTGRTDEQMYDGKIHILKQIKAIREIRAYGIKAGTVGGWISEDASLSQEGDAWVTAHSHLYGKSHVSGDVLIYQSNIYDSSIQGFGLIESSSIFSSSLLKTHFNNVASSHLSSVTSTGTELQLWKSVLKNANLNKSRFFMEASTLESSVDVPLLIEITLREDMLRIYDSEIYLETGYPQYARLHTKAEIRNVNVPSKAPLTSLVGFESFFWNHLELSNMGFFYGSPHEKVRKSSKNGHSILAGTEQQVLSLADASVQSENSEVSGEVYLEGVIFLEHCKIIDMASVINKSDYDLVMKNVQVSEMASIRKVNNIYSRIDDCYYDADQVVILD